MSEWVSKVRENLRASALALLVHVILFALMGVSLSWNRTIKPSAMQPIQAVAIIEPEIIEEKPKPEPIPKPEPEPEPLPEPPKPKPKPKPVKTVYSYPCAGKQLETDSEEKAEALQAECEEDERKKKELAELKRKEELKQKELAEKKRLEEEKRKKELAEKKRKEDAQKEKELAENKRKEEEKKKKELAEKKRKQEEQEKKELAEKKRKEAERKKKELADKKRKQEAARKKAAADARRKQEAALQAKIEGERIAGEAATALGLAVGRIKAAVDSNWIQPQTSTLGLEALVRVNVRPTGEVMSARVVRSSGNALFDRSAEIAILKASPLPIPTDPRYYPHIKEFNFRFKPNG